MSPDNRVVFTEGNFNVLPKATAVVISGSFGITNGLQRSKFIITLPMTTKVKVHHYITNGLQKSKFIITLPMTSNFKVKVHHYIQPTLILSSC